MNKLLSIISQKIKEKFSYRMKDELDVKSYQESIRQYKEYAEFTRKWYHFFVERFGSREMKLKLYRKYANKIFYDTSYTKYLRNIENKKNIVELTLILIGLDNGYNYKISDIVENDIEIVKKIANINPEIYYKIRNQDFRDKLIDDIPWILENNRKIYFFFELLPLEEKLKILDNYELVKQIVLEHRNYESPFPYSLYEACKDDPEVRADVEKFWEENPPIDLRHSLIKLDKLINSLESQLESDRLNIDDEDILKGFIQDEENDSSLNTEPSFQDLIDKCIENEKTLLSEASDYRDNAIFIFKVFERNKNIFRFSSYDLRNNLKLAYKFLEGLTNYEDIRFFGLQVLDNEEFMLTAFERFNESYRYASWRLKMKREFSLYCVQNSMCLLHSVPDCFFFDEEFKEARRGK
ncbi:MAG: hypothetical protein JXR48_01995 [Candidatus Delongbacteria bacterium]|nr:hypothetical protein [Candidatus Delongbacteria bacterium]MBN2833717.1 hypothetical protein [Candidatus Delongbacteria bacterium]